MPIVIQLKSTQDRQALGDIGEIARLVKNQNGYRIRGHEIQQLRSVMKKTAMSERAEMVAEFCSRNEIEYLSYHAPIFENGENIWDEMWRREIQDSIIRTVEEAELTRDRSGISNDVVVVFHLTTFVQRADLPITVQRKKELRSRAEEVFVRFMEEDKIASRKGIVLAAENLYQKFYPNHAIVGPCHPDEVSALEDCGIRTVFDLSHYHLYSSYMRHGAGNQLGDLDRQIYGAEPPSWDRCIQSMSKSLVGLHISDARGFDPKSEGLPLGQGEIPMTQVLQRVHSLGREIRGTIELTDGHLDRGRSQLESTMWLLGRARQVFS